MSTLTGRPRRARNPRTQNSRQRPHSFRTLPGHAIGWTVVAAIVACWELGTRQADSLYAPPPSAIAGRLRELWFSGPAGRLWLTDEALANIPPSIMRLLLGWTLAAVIGIALGLAIGRLPLLSDLLEPALHFVRAIPPPALVPVWMVLLSAGDVTQIVVIAFGVVWPILLSTMDGARSVEPVQHDTARIYRLTAAERLTFLIIPSAAPKIFAGLRVALGLSVILMVVSELTGVADGIAFTTLVLSASTFDMPQMWGGIVALGVLGYILAKLLDLVERRALARHPHAHPARNRAPGDHP